jgi:glutamyl endopeptidase
MRKQLKSVSNPAPSGRESAAIVEGVASSEILPGKVGTLGDEPSLAVEHLVVRGKRSEPISKVGPNLFETVIGKDDRTRVLETKKSPWRMICALEIQGPFGNFGGTGWLVGPKTLITAGHCVHEMHQMGGWARTIRVSPGRNGEERPFGYVDATKFTSTDAWIADQNPDYDIGCIHLSDPIGHNLGWFSIASLSDKELQESLVNICGYPADRGGGLEQYFQANRILRVGPRRIFYDIDTFGGQSGAPVWIYKDGSDAPVGVAIHAYGTSATPDSFKITANSAPRILPEVLEQIKAWIASDG